MHLIYFDHSRETKEMISGQTKISVDTSKEVQNDLTLKTKVIYYSKYLLKKFFCGLVGLRDANRLVNLY